MLAGLAGATLVLLVLGALLWGRLEKEPADLAGSGDDGTTYLLIGSDSRAGLEGEPQQQFGTEAEVPGARADVVLLVRKDAKGVRSLAVPRDLVIFEKGRGPNRLTLTFDRGPGAVASAICNSIGIGVDHVVVTEFDGLRSLVELAGGVDVVAEATMRDRSSGLLVKKGPNRLGPDQALAYVRARQVEVQFGDGWVPDPKLSARRAPRASEVLRSLADRLPVGLLDPVGTLRTAWTGLGSVSVDEGTGPLDLRSMAGALAALDDDTIATLPVAEVPGPVPIADLAPEAPRFVAQFLGGDRTSPTCTAAVLLPAPG